MKNAVIHQKQSRGFTLIELLIVIVLVGILGLWYVNGTKGADDNAKIGALAKVAQSATNTFMLINMSCGTTTNISSSNISTAGTAAGAVTVILTGTGLDSQFQTCFDNSGAKPLNGASRGDAGNERVQGYRVTATQIDASHIGWTFADVNEKTALAGYTKYSSASGAASATSLPAGGDSTDPYYRISPVSGGLTNVTFVQAI